MEMMANRSRDNHYAFANCHDDLGCFCTGSA
jgi:hypothetical protein